MPEGHTVHRLANTFAALFTGQQLGISSPQGRFADGAAVIDGRWLIASQAYGKHMYLGFGDEPARSEEDLLWLRVHLGLYGSWTFSSDGTADVAHAIGAPRKRIGERETTLAPQDPGEGSSFVAGLAGDGVWQPPPPRGQVRARLETEWAVADLNGPSACEVIDFEAKLISVAKLGPDPIRHDADAQLFIDRAKRSRTSIGAMLMNQQIIAGVGNIYRAEALFRAGIDPLAPGNTLTSSQLQDIWDDLVILMRDGVRVGAIITTEPDDRLKGLSAKDFEPGRPVTRQNTDDDPDAVPRNQSFYTYHRTGSPCRLCQTPIAMRELQARKLYWCPTCQK